MAFSEKERDAFILECLSQGMSLSELQDQLVQQHGIHMTYMELRMLTADLQVNWEKQDAKAQAAKAKAAPAAPQPAASQASAEDAREEMPDDFADDAPTADELPEEDPTAPETPAKDAVLRGKTTVEVSKVVRPGAAMSGNVTFGSGASGEWYLDQYGRLGLSLAEGSSKPDQQDVQEFQVELQKALGY